MRKKKNYDDEWKAKKVFTKLDRKQKRTFAFKNTIGVYKHSVRKNGIITKKPPKIQTEVVVKITGASRNYGSLKAHLRYISRGGELAVETNTNEVFQGKENLKDLADSFNDYRQDIPTESFLRDNNLKEKREALHIVFSMRDITHASPSKIKESAMKTIDELYPNNHYAIAFHGDTDNPHCHLVLKVKDINGKRIKIDNYHKIREKFAENLRNLGINATATKRKDREYRHEFTKTYNQTEQHKSHHYEIVDFGKAPYKFNDDNKMSYFVRYRTSKGKDIDIWADDLERVIEQNQIQKGEFVRFAITGEAPVEIKIQDKKSKQWYQKTVYKKTWDASIEKRAEKILNPLKKFTPNEFKKIDEKGDMEKVEAFKEAQTLLRDYKPDANSFAFLKTERGQRQTDKVSSVTNFNDPNFRGSVPNDKIIPKETKQSNTITQAEMEAIKKEVNQVGSKVLNSKNENITKKEKGYE